MIRLLGLDVGSTTTSLLMAEAELVRNCVTGRREFGPPRRVASPETVFTPRAGDGLDVDALDAWIGAQLGSLGAPEGGGALLTGFAARAPNAASLRARLRQRFPGLLVAAAADPHLESWLAFHGSCGALSRAFPVATFLNLDVGGGTTNLALGRAGEVLATASLWIGARHVELSPDTDEIVRASEVGTRVLARTGVTGVAPFFAAALAGFLRGETIEPWLVDVPWSQPPDVREDVRIVFSGGVGALFYQDRAGVAPAGAAPFGDLGLELARALNVEFGGRATDEPPHRGRATVNGITLHHTEISGATVHVGRPGLLPLADVPVVGSITWDGDGIERLPLGSGAVCVRLAGQAPAGVALRRFAARVTAALDARPARPVVFLTEADVGKTLGNFLTDWGRRPRDVIVLDELPATREARFGQIGAPLAAGVPVTLYDLR